MAHQAPPESPEGDLVSRRTVLRVQLSLRGDEAREGKTEKKRRRDDKIQCTTESSFHGKHRHGGEVGSQTLLLFLSALPGGVIYIRIGKLTVLSGRA